MKRWIGSRGGDSFFRSDLIAWFSKAQESAASQALPACQDLLMLDHISKVRPVLNQSSQQQQMTRRQQL